MLMGWLLKEVCPPQVPIKHSFPGSWELASIPTLFQKRTRKKKRKRNSILSTSCPTHSLVLTWEMTHSDLITVLAFMSSGILICSLKVKVLILNKGERVCAFSDPAKWPRLPWFLAGTAWSRLPSRFLGSAGSIGVYALLTFSSQMLSKAFASGLGQRTNAERVCVPATQEQQPEHFVYCQARPGASGPHCDCHAEASQVFWKRLLPEFPHTLCSTSIAETGASQVRGLCVSEHPMSSPTALGWGRPPCVPPAGNAWGSADKAAR